MKFDIKHLSEHITPNTTGIIWLTDDFLSYDTPGVYEFNYLLNSMLVKTISQSQEDKSKKVKSNFFLGDNFGKSFFIGHCVVHDKDDLKAVHNHFELASSFLEDGATIYIYNRSKNTANTNVLKELSKKYQNLEFKNLNI